MSKAIEDVLAERGRQINEEGWSPEHDDQHDAGDLSAAGAAYALNAADQIHPYSQGDGGNEMPSCWPFATMWWKPKNPRRDLVRAAALIIAELDREPRCTSTNALTQPVTSAEFAGRRRTEPDGFGLPVAAAERNPTAMSSATRISETTGLQTHRACRFRERYGT